MASDKSNDSATREARKFEKKLEARRAKGGKELKKFLEEFGGWDSKRHDALRDEFEKGLKPSEFFLERFPSIFGSWIPERNRDAFLWAIDHCLERPYETGWSRRPIRSPKYVDYVGVIEDIVSNFTEVAVLDEELADILSGNIPSDAKAYLEYCDEKGYYPEECCPELIAYAIDSGDARVKELVRASLNNEEGAPRVCREIFLGVLLSRDRSLHELLGKLLLAARLQEGLRQSICECADEGTIDGFKTILKVIDENNLIRFSSVKRAVGVWTGLGTEDSKDLERISAKTLRLLLTGLDDEKTRKAWLRSKDVMELYMALWTQAVTDQYKAEELAEKTLKAKSCTRNQALTVGVFASAIHTQSIRHRLATIAVAKYPQDQEILALFLPFLMTEHRYEDLKSYEEKGTHGSVLRYFDDETAARDLLAVLFEHFDRLKSAKTKEKTFSGCVFPWLDVKLTQSDLAIKIAYLAVLLDDEEAQDRAIKMIPNISADWYDRKGVAISLLSRPKRPAQFRGLYDALTDRESLTREAAFEIASKISPFELDFSEFEKALRLKTEDIRVNCVSLLMRQDDAGLLASVGRLLDDSLETRRRGAYDLIIRIAADEKRQGLKAPCAEQLVAREPKDAQERLPWDAALGAVAPEKDKSEARSLYFDESDAYAPDISSIANDPRCLETFARFYPDSELPKNPTITGEELAERRENKTDDVCASCLQARKDALALDNLIKKHKDDSIGDWFGEEETLGHGHVGVRRFYAEEKRPFPLAELWEEWYDKLGSPERLARVIALLYADASSLDVRIDYLLGSGFSNPQRHAFKDVMKRVCGYLWGEHSDGKTRFASSLAVADWFVRSLPENDAIWDSGSFVFARSTNVYVHCLTCHPQIFWLLLGLIDCPAEDSDRAFVARVAIYKHFENICKKAWQITPEREEEKYSNVEPSCIIDPERNNISNEVVTESATSKKLDPGFRAYLLAATRGIVSERALAEYAFRNDRSEAAFFTSRISLFERRRQGRIQKSDVRGDVASCYEWSLDQVECLLGKKENFTPKDEAALKFVDEFYSKLEDVIVESELSRGDADGKWSYAATNLSYCSGVKRLGVFLGALGSEPLRWRSWHGRSRRSNLLYMVKMCVPTSEDDATAFAAIVKRYNLSEKRLVELAMFNPSWIRFVAGYLKAPGFESAAYYFIAHVCDELDESTTAIISHYATLSTEELQSGAFDAAWFRSAYEQVGEKWFAALYDAAKYIADGARHSRARKYADAANGKLDLDATEAQIREKRNKDLLAAYAVAPVKDESDAARRFAFIQEFAKGAKNFGPQRAESERLAGALALTNLATNTGDKDAARLTLRMEAYFAENTAPYFQPRPVADLEVRLKPAPNGGVAIVCTKDGKDLKSVPSRINKDPYIVQLKEAKTELNDQYSRTRLFLETAMTEETALTAQELRGLLGNPNLRPLAETLIFQSDDRFGTPCDDGLKDCDGKVVPWKSVKEAIVAHPYRLFETKTWGKWRGYIFESKIKQPFKQAFRELYLKTEEELDRRETARYAGCQIQPTKAATLLKKRGWRVDWYDGLGKFDRRHKISATLVAEADWFTPADIEAPTLDGVEFSGVDKIKDVPDVLFSEIMRDVDLAVSVAHAGRVDPEASHSTMEMRAELLRLTLPMFGLTNVKVEDRRAIVEGKLSSYSVHLGSGVVRQEGGGMLNIVAVHSQHRGKIFLPFVDDDPQTAAILTKVLFLAEDSKIQDPSIVEQIKFNNSAR